MPALQLSHEDLVNRICVSHPDMNSCCELTKRGFMRFTGNQWNESWEWIKEALVPLPDSTLIWLHQTVQKRTGE